MINKFRKGGQKALKNFKAFAQNTKRYDKNQTLASGSVGDDLLYAANPIYIETSQGGTSSLRGFGAIMLLAAVAICITIGADGIYSGIKHRSIILIAISPILLVLSTLPFALLYYSFFTPTDIVVRFDRKRQLALMWTHKGPIEIPWENLTPIVQGMATSPMLPSRTYRGMYVDYGPDGEPRSTHGVPHIIQIGQPMGAEEGALLYLEYVRRYMQEGLQAVPQPKKWLRHRPKWRSMFNFANLVNEWEIKFNGRTEFAPWTETILFSALFVVVFPMQVTHWLALKVAPLPRWPKELDAQYTADLAEIGLRLQGGWQQTPRRQPVVRINGEPQAPTSQVEALPSTTDTGWRDRLAAWVAIPLAFGSPILFWGGLAMPLPFEMTLTEIFLWPVLMGCAATATALLSLPRPGQRLRLDPSR